MVHPPAQRRELTEAFAYCERLAQGHYENFTVASWFLPRALRPSMYALYAFCRHTDDLGDEVAGDRLALLDAWEADLRRCYGGEPQHSILVALQATVHRHGIPPEPFLNLIEANRMDQRVSEYETFADLLLYCGHSANPVGRMVLHVFGSSDDERQPLSDTTCTALQLANFWQDVRRDLAMGRVYIPQEDLRRFGYSKDMLERGEVNPAFQELMAFEVARTRALFREGTPLAGLVDGPLRLDVRLFTAAGLSVLDAIQRQRYNVLAGRPSVSKLTKGRLLVTALVGLARQRLSGDGYRG